jgi:hypothetical protein
VSTWIACHRQAFTFWGGVPRRLVPDNLKAAVQRAAIDDPILGEAYRRMALHYGFLVSPTRPATPHHKGKIENGVHYVKRNFLAGREFLDIDMANRELRTWLMETAGSRIHGTTHQPPWRLFVEHERPALLPLLPEPFTLVEIKPVKVHPDCHVTLEGSFYSVPYRYCGQTLEAHLHERVVELYEHTTLVSTHPRAGAAGQWHTRLEDYPQEKAAYLLHTPQVCRQQAAQIGPATLQVVDQLLGERPLDRLRAGQGLLRLEEAVGAQRLERACARALHFGQASYRQVKAILNAALDQEPLPDDESSDGGLVPTTGHFVFARAVQEFFSLPSDCPQSAEAAR